MSDCLSCARYGVVTLLLLNIADSSPANAAHHGALHPSRTQQASSIEAQIEFEETDSANIHLQEHNGQYTLSATYLEHKLSDSEFGKHIIKSRPITRWEYFTVWNALKDAGFRQTISMRWPTSAQQAGQIAGIIHIKAAEDGRGHEVAEYVSQDATWIGSRGRGRKRDAIRTVAKMILALVKRNAHEE